MNKQKLTNQNNNSNHSKIIENSKLKSKPQSMFSYDEQKNILNLT